MSLNRQKLEALVAQNFDLHIYETLPSTNQTLWQRVEEGAKPGSVVIAVEQTKGRGQRGHQWYSPRGGLYLSIALAPNIPVSESFQLTIRTAWGVATTLNALGIPVRLKWLNDLWLNDRKLGGILTETKINQGIITSAIVGVGINWTNPVPETGINLSSYINTISSLEMLATITIQGIQKGIDEPVANLVPAYEELLINIGQKVKVGDRTGIVVGVNNSGYLRVCLDGEKNTSINPVEVCLKPGSISLS